MKKYFIYTGEYISGGRYWIRMLLQYFTVAFFGLGFYLQAITMYTRARSLNHSHSGALLITIGSFFLGLIYLAIALNDPYSDRLDYIGLELIIAIPHLYLWFSNGNPPYKYEKIPIKPGQNNGSSEGFGYDGGHNKPKKNNQDEEIKTKELNSPSKEEDGYNGNLYG
tara:strand:+ start:3128 stop:3628 length:501 start_codon:yes stop_codon:yes gene_type:complete